MKKHIIFLFIYLTFYAHTTYSMLGKFPFLSMRSMSILRHHYPHLKSCRLNPSAQPQAYKNETTSHAVPQHQLTAQPNQSRDEKIQALMSAYLRLIKKI